MLPATTGLLGANTPVLLNSLDTSCHYVLTVQAEGPRALTQSALMAGALARRIFRRGRGLPWALCHVSPYLCEYVHSLACHVVLIASTRGINFDRTI